MGALMGAGVGLSIGFIFGSYSILRFACSIDSATLFHSFIMLGRGGAGSRGILPTLSQYMFSSAATFAFFLSIGSVSFICTHRIPLFTKGPNRFVRR